MSTETNKVAVRRFRAAFDAGNLEEAFGAIARDAILHEAPDPLLGVSKPRDAMVVEPETLR